MKPAGYRLADVCISWRLPVSIYHLNYYFSTRNSLQNSDQILELLSHDKVELTSACIPGVTIIETISPVKSHQAKHWKEDPDTKTRRTLDAEWIIIRQVIP